jgi:hypothetical protein
MDDSKVYVGLTSILIKEVQSILQKIITWTTKSGKGQQVAKGMHNCCNASLQVQDFCED